MSRHRSLFAIARAARPFLPSCAAHSLGAADDIPSSPRDLTFEELVFEVPRAEGLRHEVAGIPVYVVEDRTLPLVDIAIQLRIGSFLEPSEQSAGVRRFHVTGR